MPMVKATEGFLVYSPINQLGCLGLKGGVDC
jgi:hypothetical protein